MVWTAAWVVVWTAPPARSKPCLRLLRPPPQGYKWGRVSWWVGVGCGAAGVRPEILVTVAHVCA